MNHRTALVSQMRGLRLNSGVTIGVSISRARRAIPMIFADLTNGLTGMKREITAELYAFLGQIDLRIKAFDRCIEVVFRANAACQRIARICGVGPETATAMNAAVGEGAEFKNSRHLAAWMGLVPRQHSSGNRQILMGISKRGDQHLRTLLVHGARSVVRVPAGKTDALNRWINSLRERGGVNRAIVAVANKNDRIIWAMLRKGMEFQSTAQVGIRIARRSRNVTGRQYPVREGPGFYNGPPWPTTCRGSPCGIPIWAHRYPVTPDRCSQPGKSGQIGSKKILQRKGRP